MNNPDWNLIATLVFIFLLYVAFLWSLDRASDNTSKDLKNALDALEKLSEKETKNGQNKNRD